MQLCSCTPTTVLPATHRGLRVALRGLPHQNQHAKAVIRWQQRRVGGVVAAEPQNGSGGAPSAAQPAQPAPPTAAPALRAPGSVRRPVALDDAVPEELFYEGSASNAELAISLLLGLVTLVYLPITIAVVGKRLWFTYRFTNKRVSIINTSPLFARTVEVAYSNIKEVRTAPRAFGLWGDAVLFLKDGSRLEITGLERFRDIERHITSCIID